MIRHNKISDAQLRKLIRARNVHFAGNLQLKIYGKFSCQSGKRMKRENRVFFNSEKEAIELSFRPCGHCMKEKYKRWKKTHAEEETQ